MTDNVGSSSIWTYAMAEMRGPLETKSSPVERTFGPWMRVGCKVGGEHGRSLDIRVVTYSPESAAVTPNNG